MSDTASSVEVSHALQKSMSIRLASAEKTLSRLCKHFQHKVEVHRAESHASIKFLEGVCIIEASQFNLDVRCQSDNAEDLLAIIDTLNRHLKAFCPSENLVLCWRDLT